MSDGSVRGFRIPRFRVVALAATFPCLGALAGGSLLTRPARASVGSPPSDLPAQPVTVRSGAGVALRGWFVRGRAGAGAVLLLHGVRANRVAMLNRARFLHAAGMSVLLFDFRAHGESTGDRITFGALESVDARAALDFLRTELPAERIGAIGVSLGGAAALLGREPLPVDALVLEAVYPAIDVAIADRLRMRLGALGPPLTPLFTLQLEPRLGVSADRLRPIDRIGAVAAPVFVMGGTRDRHTPPNEVRAMFDHAREPKELWAVPGAGHEDLHAFARAAYEARVLAFFRRHLRADGGAPA